MIFAKKIIQILRYYFLYLIIKKLRLFCYFILSDANNVIGKPIKNQPLLLKGNGEIKFGNNVQIGVEKAPEFYSTYCHLNAQNKNSKIVFGNDIYINNNFSAISEGNGIFIGNNTLIGLNVSIIDTDFHHISPEKRMMFGYPKGLVKIGENVWIGNNVSILKDSEIGKNSIVAAGAVVSGLFPDNVIIGGVPAKVIKEIND